MDPALLITGVIVGFFVAAPVGPVAVLCMQRTLRDGRIVGYATGFGAAVADTVFGGLAIFSVAVVEDFLLDNRSVIQFLGGFILIGLGVWTVMASRSRTQSDRVAESTFDHVTILHAFGAAFFVTIVNPITILAFVSIFAAIRVSEATDGLFSTWVVIGGVFVGATAWWFFLASIASILRQRFTNRGIRWMNAVSGMTILSFGAYALLALIWR